MKVMLTKLWAIFFTAFNNIAPSDPQQWHSHARYW